MQLIKQLKSVAVFVGLIGCGLSPIYGETATIKLTIGNYHDKEAPTRSVLIDLTENGQALVGVIVSELNKIGQEVSPRQIVLYWVARRSKVTVQGITSTASSIFIDPEKKLEQQQIGDTSEIYVFVIKLNANKKIDFSQIDYLSSEEQLKRSVGLGTSIQKMVQTYYDSFIEKLRATDGDRKEVVTDKGDKKSDGSTTD